MSVSMVTIRQVRMTSLVNSFQYHWQYLWSFKPVTFVACLIQFQFHSESYLALSWMLLSLRRTYTLIKKKKKKSLGILWQDFKSLGFRCYRWRRGKLILPWRCIVMSTENNSQVLGHELTMDFGLMCCLLCLAFKSSGSYQRKKLVLDIKCIHLYKIGSGIRHRSFFSKHFPWSLHIFHMFYITKKRQVI